MFDGDAEQAPDNEDDEYTFDDIIGYLEYLKSLQTLESKLKLQLEEEGQQLPQKDTVEEKQGEDTPPQQEMGKIRRKRSMDGEKNICNHSYREYLIHGSCALAINGPANLPICNQSINIGWLSLHCSL